MEIKFVSFDLSDQSFTFYTQIEWHNLIADARNELQEEFSDSDPDAADLGEAYHWSVDEVLDAVYGDEFFWDEVVKSS